MKKFFIGLAAVAALAATICMCGLIASDLLSKNKSALCASYCAYQPGKDCTLSWPDGDSYTAKDFVGIRDHLVIIRNVRGYHEE